MTRVVGDYLASGFYDVGIIGVRTGVSEAISLIWLELLLQFELEDWSSAEMQTL